ncbi:hypothetical protein YC2023_020272 [Brassica napus]
MASFNATHGLELIDQRSFAKPDRFKLHPFIFVLLRRGRRPRLVRTTLWTCFVFFVHLRHRPKTKPPRTSLSQASVSPPQIVASVSDHRTISVSNLWIFSTSHRAPTIERRRWKREDGDGDVTAARREDADTTARREEADTAALWCGGDVVTTMKQRHARRQTGQESTGDRKKAYGSLVGLKMKTLLSQLSTIKFIIEIKMVASRIVEFLEDQVEEIDVLKVTEGGGNCDCPVSGVRCLAGVRGDLPLPDTEQRDRMVFSGDRWWYFSLPFAFRLDLMYEGPLGKLFALVARRSLGGCSLLEDDGDAVTKPQVSPRGGNLSSPI